MESLGVFRYSNLSTHANIEAILDLIRHPGTTRVTLFASPEEPTGDYTQSDGPETNLPLVVALAEFEIMPHICTIWAVFDGVFLTAARCPRYLEVKTLLDEAEVSRKVFFATQRAPFTSSLTAEAAAGRLKSVGEVVALTPDTRAAYFSLLSTVSEDEYKNEYQAIISARS